MKLWSVFMNHELWFVQDPNAGIAGNFRSGFANGELFCEFQRTPVLESLDEIEATFDLQNDKYNLLLARGRVDAGGFLYTKFNQNFIPRLEIQFLYFYVYCEPDFMLSYHSLREPSPTSVYLSETIIIGEVCKRSKDVLTLKNAID